MNTEKHEESLPPGHDHHASDLHEHIDESPLPQPGGSPEPGPFPAEEFPSGSTLSEAWVAFYTTDEDKDWDTAVIVTLENARRSVVAQLNLQSFGQFPDNSYRGPYLLDVRPGIDKASFQNTRATIKILPDRNDTWRFKLFVFLRFSDRSTLKAEVDNIELSEDRDNDTFLIGDLLQEGPPEIGPILDEVNIAFRTNDEDKDKDTNVTITVEDANGAVVARLSDWLEAFGRFDDNSNQGPIPIAVLNPALRELVQSGRLIIQINPNGNDTWRFNFDLVLSFSDGTILEGGVNGLQLSEDDREVSFGIEELMGYH